MQWNFIEFVLWSFSTHFYLRMIELEKKISVGAILIEINKFIFGVIIDLLRFSKISGILLVISSGLEVQHRYTVYSGYDES